MEKREQGARHPQGPAEQRLGRQHGAGAARGSSAPQARWHEATLASLPVQD